MASRMSAADREAMRQRFREQAIAEADRRGRSMRCQRAADLAGAPPALIREQHRACLGESPGGAGCLCECHDNPGVTVEEAAS